jgi:dTDP-4-amino-4,6-dideoxygalactose transaminase
VRRLRTHGSEEKYRHDEVGGNFRLDEIQAAALNVLADRFEAWQAARAAHAVRYLEALAAAGVAGRGVVLPRAVRPHGWHQFVIRTPRRDALRAHLAAAGVQTEVYYPVPLHLQPCFRRLGHREGAFPEAERAARETLALPVHPALTPAQQDRVIDAIISFFAGG